MGEKTVVGDGDLEMGPIPPPPPYDNNPGNSTTTAVQGQPTKKPSSGRVRKWLKSAGDNSIPLRGILVMFVIFILGLLGLALVGMSFAGIVMVVQNFLSVEVGSAGSSLVLTYETFSSVIESGVQGKGTFSPPCDGCSKGMIPKLDAIHTHYVNPKNFVDSMLVGYQGPLQHPDFSVEVSFFLSNGTTETKVLNASSPGAITDEGFELSHLFEMEEEGNVTIAATFIKGGEIYPIYSGVPQEQAQEAVKGLKARDDNYWLGVGLLVPGVVVIGLITLISVCIN